MMTELKLEFRSITTMVLAPHDDSTGCGNAWYFYGYDYIYICDNMLTEELLAHEYTHGITYYTAELGLTFEQGALNVP